MMQTTLDSLIPCTRWPGCEKGENHSGVCRRRVKPMTGPDYEHMEIVVKGEDRERIKRNRTKMGVAGRSAFLLLNLARQQAARRNTRRLRKGR